MSGAKIIRILWLATGVVLAHSMSLAPAMARSASCWSSIACAAGKAIIEGLVRRGLDQNSKAGSSEPPAAAPEPPQRSEQPLPPARIPVCEVVRDCRVVAAGPCFRVSPTTIRCPRQRQCRVRRVCGKPL